MAKYRVGIMGTGRPWRVQGAKGSGLSHVHANAYEASPDCEIVAAADIVQENVDAFCQEHHVPHAYLDYREMLEKEQLDIVSIAVWRPMHTPMIVAAAGAGVKAIHCEKPMAHTWANALKQVAVCKEHGVQLTFDHQNRFHPGHVKARELLNAGAIGQLLRIDSNSGDLFEVGTHWFDLSFYFNNDEPVDWVMGQIEARGGSSRMPIRDAGQAVSFFKWRNGVYGFMTTGSGGGRGSGMLGGIEGMDCHHRLVGTEGVMEVGVLNGPTLRMMNADTGGTWQSFEFPFTPEVFGKEAYEAAVGLNERLPGHQWQNTMGWIAQVAAGILDLVDCLKTGREPELDCSKALKATEVAFATLESSRKRGRVELPLEIDDNPFLSMLEQGAISAEE